MFIPEQSHFDNRHQTDGKRTANWHQTDMEWTSNRHGMDNQTMTDRTSNGHRTVGVGRITARLSSARARYTMSQKLGKSSARSRLEIFWLELGSGSMVMSSKARQAFFKLFHIIINYNIKHITDISHMNNLNHTHSDF